MGASQSEGARSHKSGAGWGPCPRRCQRREVRHLQAELVRVRAVCEKQREALQIVVEAGQCPIKYGLPKDPVVASDGQTYERRAIQRWLYDHGSSPVTRGSLLSEVYPNRFAAGLFQKLRELGLASTEAAEEEEEDEYPEVLLPPSPEALHYAIDRKDADAALRLLRHFPLPGLNDLNRGASALVQAIRFDLPEVALAILARHDFARVNLKLVWGQTALHVAASQGYLCVCQAILERADFRECLAVSTEPWFFGTASRVARACHFEEIAEVLEEQEDRLRRAQ